MMRNVERLTGARVKDKSQGKRETHWHLPFYIAFPNTESFKTKREPPHSMKRNRFPDLENAQYLHTDENQDILREKRQSFLGVPFFHSVDRTYGRIP